MSAPTPDRADSSPSRGRRPVRRALAWITILYAALLAGGLAMLDFRSEPHWFWSGLLFLPPQLWLLPLVILLPLALRWHPRLCLVHLLVVAGLSFGYMRFRWHRPPQPRGPVLTLLTANVAQGDPRSLAAFLPRVQPDVIVYQDARRPDLLPTSGRTDWFTARQREFVVASRFPIRRSGLVESLRYNRQPVTAWFELDWNGRELVIYNVHMPTPRRFLARFRGQGYGVDAIRWQRVFSQADRQASSAYWQERHRLASGLCAVLRQETRPMLIAGDFNMPDHGWLYRMMVRDWTDAFAAGGRGWGMTFPGTGGLIQKLLGPWLRLDYVFCDARWRVLDCEIEPPQPAEHRALAARMEWQGDRPGHASP